MSDTKTSTAGEAQPLMAVTSSALIAERRTTKKLRAELRALVATCESCLSALDREMKQPSNEQRGKRVAYICNQLELQKDMAKHFGLGMPLRADKKPSSAIRKWKGK
jgi:hypothetical protein